MTGERDETVPYIVSCAECDERAAASQPGPVAEFYNQHSAHTGHELVWEAWALPPEFDLGEQFEVRCMDCLDKWVFPTKIEADEWAVEHERWTDHAPSEVRVQEDGDLLSADHMSSVVGLLETHFPTGVPQSLIVELFTDDQPITPDDVDERLTELVYAGDCYETGADRIKST